MMIIFLLCISAVTAAESHRSSRQIGGRRIIDLPCVPDNCGINAQCTVQGGFEVCRCLPGYFGDARSVCSRGECEINEDCPAREECFDNYCRNPCRKCTTNANCEIRNHVAFCSCPAGFTGDAAHQCIELPRDPCANNPCGANTRCKAVGNAATCECLPGFISSGQLSCRYECETNRDCNYNQACINNKCANPCTGHCGEGAICRVERHRATCTCPQFYKGSPYTRCYPECTTHYDCHPQQACRDLQCIDPCKEHQCGQNAICEVRGRRAQCRCPDGYFGLAHQRCRSIDSVCSPNPCGVNAICTPKRSGYESYIHSCTCPQGFLGNPNTECNRGECSENTDCRHDQACYDYHCENPCRRETQSCGRGAVCEAKNHIGVCKCPPGTGGDARSLCIANRGSRRHS